MTTKKASNPTFGFENSSNAFNSFSHSRSLHPLPARGILFTARYSAASLPPPLLLMLICRRTSPNPPRPRNSSTCHTFVYCCRRIPRAESVSYRRSSTRSLYTVALMRQWSRSDLDDDGEVIVYLIVFAGFDCRAVSYHIISSRLVSHHRTSQPCETYTSGWFRGTRSQGALMNSICE